MARELRRQCTCFRGMIRAHRIHSSAQKTLGKISMASVAKMVRHVREITTTIQPVVRLGKLMVPKGAWPIFAKSSSAVCTGTAPATAATAAATAAPSYVPNSYFSFPYAPTTYASEGACKSAVKACSQNYDACVADLGDGETYGVTIAVPDGGGVTVGGSGATLGASATPICSSLSSRACSDLDKLDCGDFGSGSNAIQGRRADLRVLVGFAGTFLALTLFA